MPIPPTTTNRTMSGNKYHNNKCHTRTDHQLLARVTMGNNWGWVETNLPGGKGNTHQHTGGGGGGGGGIAHHQNHGQNNNGKNWVAWHNGRCR